MKNTLKVINTVLLALAIIAVGFGIYGYLQFRSVPTEEYDAAAADLQTQTQQADAETAGFEADMAARQDALREDVSQGGEEGESLAAAMTEARTANEEKAARLEELRAENDRLDNIVEETLAKRHEYGLKIRELEEMVVNDETDIKICYWTFDDGPTRLTSQFLDQLKELDVHVTFFTSHEANESEDEPEMLRRELAEGHTVANHTYSHQFAALGNLYQTTDGLLEMIEKQDEWVYACTGFHTDIFRFPGGSAWGKSILGEDPTAAIEEAGYKWIEWSCDVYDNGVAGMNADDIRGTAVWQAEQMDIAVILSHDWNNNTLLGFPGAMKQLREAGYVFLPLLPESITMGEYTKIMFS